MNAFLSADFARRDFLKGAGALIVGFSIAKTIGGSATAMEIGPYGPPEDQVDSWIAIGEDGHATLFTGCCELGTGSSTGLMQVMAEELDVPFERVRLFGPDTNRTPDQFVSSGSRTISAHSRPIRQAAAEARAALVEMAAKHLTVPVEQLMTADGVVSVRGNAEKKITYAELVGGKQFNVKVTGKVKPKAPSEYRLVGTSVPRWDIPEKIFATFTYMQDVKVPDMLHGRVVRPPAHGATVMAIDESSVAQIPGLVKVVRKGDLVGVVCEREEQAIAAAQTLKVAWSDWAGLPDMKDLHSTLRNLPEFAEGYPKELRRTARQERRCRGGLKQSGQIGEGDLSVAFQSSRLHRTVLRGGRCARRRGDALVRHTNALRPA